MEENVYQKIISKKEFSKLPKKDVEKVYSLYKNRQTTEKEKIKLTRETLKKAYFAFASKKLLNESILNKKTPEEILKKHRSTQERIEAYKKLYPKITEKNTTIIDLGSGINGLSYEYFDKKLNLNYIGIEAVGQLVNLTNEYFKKNKIKNAKTIQESLFDIEKIKKIINEVPGKKTIFLFKVLDSLETIERHYSKKMLTELIPIVDKAIISFATKSIISRKSFKVKRFWFENFSAKMGWKIIDSFEIEGEKYFVISEK